MNNIQKIKSQLNKIKSLVKKEREQDKKTIAKLQAQLKQIDISVANLDKMAKKIKGGKLRIQKAGGCPFLKEEFEGGKRRRKKRSRKKR